MDDELVEVYVAFLKSLSLKIFNHPIELFFNDVNFFFFIFI